MKKDVFEELVVVKRSGQRVNFNGYKIAVAIKQAFDYVYGTYDEKQINTVYEGVLKHIESEYQTRKTINVEDIQDIIETKLKEEKFTKVYEAFHNYRLKRAASRKVFTIKAQHKFVKAMERIASDNSLKGDHHLKPNEILLNYGKTVANEFTKSYIIDGKYLRAHEEGSIFIRDMEDFPLGIISSAHLRFNEYLRISNSLNNLTSQILKAGEEINHEISIPALDNLLDSWLVRQYKFYYQENIINYTKVMGINQYLNIKKILELIERENEVCDKTIDFTPFIHNGQVEQIFKSAYLDCLNKINDILVWKINKLFLNLDTGQSNDQKVSISFGTNETLAGKLVNEAIIKVLANSEPFPNLCLIFKVKKAVYETYLEDITELIVKGHNLAITFPENSFNKDQQEAEYFASGTRVFENINGEVRVSAGRMVVHETAINMSRLGIKYAGKPLKELYKELDELLELVKNELLLAFEMIGNKNKDNYQILFTYNNILDDDKLEHAGKIRKVIKNGNLNIGLVGFKEGLLALEKDEQKQYDLAIDLLNYLNKKCRAFINETKLNFYLSEPACRKARRGLMGLDKAIYGEIKGITDKKQYGLISELPSIKEDYKRLANIQKLLVGGSMLRLGIAKNISNKRLSQIIKDLMAADIGFVKFYILGLGGSNEY